MTITDALRRPNQSSAPEAPEVVPGKWTSPIAQATVGGYSANVTITRAAGNGGELVFIEADGQAKFFMTRERAADLAEAIHKVSGMATSSYEAPFMAEVVRDSLARKGVTRARVCEETGITGYRLRKILSAEAPMTHDEHVAISEVEQAHV